MTYSMVFSLIVTPSIAPYDEAMASAGSLVRNLPMDAFSHRMLAYDRRYASYGRVSELLSVLDGFEPVEVPPMERSLQLCGCRQLDFVSAALSANGSDAIMSVPSNWLLRSRIDVSKSLLAATSPDVFSVFLGGCPLAHVDSGGYFSMCDSTLPKYRRLRTSSWNLPGLDRGECPSIFNSANFPEIFKAGQCNLNFLNRCGWDPKLQVLYPEALKSSPSDLKPEPFVDIVGICPEYWDRFEFERS